jgi:VanZ family protein
MAQSTIRMIQFYYKKAIWLGLTIAWTLMIIYLSVRPGTNELLKKQFLEVRTDYLLHFLAYFAFGSLYVLWRGNRQFEIRSIELAILTAAAISFSILMEYIQLLIPGRTFNVVDMVYNILGVIGGVGFTYFYVVRRFLKRRGFTQTD